MNLLLVAPLLLTVLGLVAGWFMPRWVSPRTATRLLAGSIVIAAAGTTAALLLVVLAGASQFAALADVLGWCRALYSTHDGAAPWAGGVALLALLAGAWRLVHYLRQVRIERLPFHAVDGVEVLNTPEPLAFAVPGRPGGVVVSSALIRQLDSDERAAVMAHERAHLTHHHHRFVHAAEACAAAFPFLVPLARQVRFLTERWADETAADVVGSRKVVARTIARVALMTPTSRPGTLALSFHGRGAAARVDALVHPPTPGRVEIPIALSLATVVATVAGSSVQVHHLASFITHACPL